MELLERAPDPTAASVATGASGADNNAIFPHAYIAPYGVNGRFLHVKTRYRFQPPAESRASDGAAEEPCENAAHDRTNRLAPRW